MEGQFRENSGASDSAPPAAAATTRKAPSDVLIRLAGDEGLIADAVAAGESHGAQAAAVEGVQQHLARGRREALPAVAAGADDGGVGGGGFGWCGLHTRLCMLPTPPPG